MLALRWQEPSQSARSIVIGEFFNRKWTTKDDDACLSMCLPCPAGQRFSPEGTSENAQRFNLAERLLHP